MKRPMNLTSLVLISGIAVVRPAAAAPAWPQTVFLIVMENQSWADIKGNAQAPYINGTLLPAAARAENYLNPLPLSALPNKTCNENGTFVSTIHPSLPNYLWFEAGSDFDICAMVNNDGDPIDYGTQLNGKDHLVKRLQAAGISWKAFQEGISGANCPLTDQLDPSQHGYAVRHNPAVYFDDVNANPDPSYCMKHVRPYSELSDATAARFNYIKPDTCNDMHDVCSPAGQIAQGDAWLSTAVPRLQSLASFRNGGAIIIAWDESSGVANDPTGLIVLEPNGRAGYSNTIRYSHGSLLHTLQDIFAVNSTYLGHAGDPEVTSLADLFQTSTGGITFHVASTNSYASGATQSLSAAIPAGAVAGDVLVASLGFGNSAATALPNFTAVPAGWTALPRAPR